MSHERTPEAGTIELPCTLLQVKMLDAARKELQRAQAQLELVQAGILAAHDRDRGRFVSYATAPTPTVTICVVPEEFELAERVQAARPEGP